MLRQYQKLTYQEIAEILGKPLNTIKSDMRRALENLRGLLSQLADIALEESK